jgi:hypothetical protein
MRIAHLFRATKQDIWQHKRVRALAANGGDFNICSRGNNEVLQEIKQHVLAIQIDSELPSSFALGDQVLQPDLLLHLSGQVLLLLLLLSPAPVVSLVLVPLRLCGVRRHFVPGGPVGDHLGLAVAAEHARCEQLALRSRAVTDLA